jgi:hypothetical protein
MLLIGVVPTLPPPTEELLDLIDELDLVLEFEGRLEGVVVAVVVLAPSPSPGALLLLLLLLV